MTSEIVLTNPKKNSWVITSPTTCFISERDNYTDIIFEVNGVTVKAHKFILCSFSSVFKKMISGEWKEKEGIISLDHDVDDFKSVISYMYGTNITCPLERIFDIHQLADYYDIETLRTECEKLLDDIVNKKNAFMIYKRAITDNLKDTCKTYIFEHFMDIIKEENITQKELSILLQEGLDYTFAPSLYKCISTWKERCKTPIDEVLLKKMYSSLNIDEFNTKKLLTEIRPTGIFSDTDILNAISKKILAVYQIGDEVLLDPEQIKDIGDGKAIIDSIEFKLDSVSYNNGLFECPQSLFQFEEN